MQAGFSEADLTELPQTVIIRELLEHRVVEFVVISVIQEWQKIVIIQGLLALTLVGLWGLTLSVIT